jgi:hypothetical protein
MKHNSKSQARTAADSSTQDEITSVSQHSRKPNVIGRVFCLLGKHDWSGSNENICQRCGKIAIGLPKFKNPPPPPVKTIYCPLAEEGAAEEVLDK